MSKYTFYVTDRNHVVISIKATDIHKALYALNKDHGLTEDDVLVIVLPKPKVK